MHVYMCRDTKKCSDKISSLERDMAETEAKLEDLKVQETHGCV